MWKALCSVNNRSCHVTANHQKGKAVESNMTSYQSCQRRKKAKQICRSEGHRAGLPEEWPVVPWWPHGPVGMAVETNQLAAQRLTHRGWCQHISLLGMIQMICSEGWRLYWIWLGWTLFTAVSVMLCFGFVAQAVLITHQGLGCCRNSACTVQGTVSLLLLPKVSRRSRLGVGKRLREGRRAGMKWPKEYFISYSCIPSNKSFRKERTKGRHLLLHCSSH